MNLFLISKRKNLLKYLETTKLFYDIYPYKLVFHNSLGYIFREKKFNFARDELDSLQLLYEKGEPLVRGSYRQKTYDISTFEECKILYREFTKRDDYKIRVENPSIQLYSHDLDWLEKIGKLVKNAYAIYKPRVPLTKNTIIIQHPSEYTYKITLPAKVDPSLSKWIRNNPSLAKAGNTCLEEISNNGYVKGFYFYVRDEKILGLVNLMLGKSCRVDKLVYSPNLDK